MKEQCVHGHSLVDGNVYVDPQKHPHCLTCRRAALRKHQEMHRDQVNAYQRARLAAQPKKPRPTSEERFLQYCSVPDANGCINWTGGCSKGHGEFRMGYTHVEAHRYAYERAKGPIPEGLTIDHLCRNRACVNPNHLEAVTMAENIRRGESPSAVNRRKIACLRGHEFTSQNTRIDSRGKRQCRVCDRQRQSEYAARRRKVQGD